jgi:hypothetical protein
VKATRGREESASDSEPCTNASWIS